MKIWIATGGTGGHIFPALSVATELVKRGHKVVVSSDSRGMPIVKKGKPEKARTAFVWASGVGAKSKIKQIAALGKIGTSALALLVRFLFSRPDKVVGFGGYACVPAVLAASVLKIPTLLHEQNGAIGRANKFALRWVKTLMTSFPKVSGIGNSGVKVVYTGLPVRVDFKKTEYEFNYNLFVTGGSLGAQILDEVVPKAVSQLPISLIKKMFVTHQTRPENVGRLQKFYAENKIRANVLSFVHDMAGTFEKSSLVIGRSGASTIAELQTVGRPAILVPLGINPDQAANAEIFAGTGAGFAVPDEKFTVKWLGSVLEELFSNPARLEKMASKAATENNAVENIVNTVIG